MPSLPRPTLPRIRQQRGPRIGDSLGIRVDNFKAIASVSLPEARLTVVTGSNSSGKSSLLQAVLFMAQSVGQATAVINGDLVRLGEPKDVIRDGTAMTNLAVEFDEATADDGAARVAVQIGLRAEGQLLKPTEVVLSVNSAVMLGSRADSCPPDLRKQLVSTETALRVDRTVDSALPPDTFLTMIGLQPGRLIYKVREADYRARFEAFQQQTGFPFLVEEWLRYWGYGFESDVLRDLARRLAAARHTPSSPSEDVFTPGELEALFQLYFQNDAPGGWASEPISLGLARPPSLPQLRSPHGAEQVGRLSAAVSVMQQLAGSVVYLGPLREDPRVAYPLGHTVTSLPVGEKGEFTAAYLEQHGSVAIRYTTPEGDLIYEQLRVAVSRWCRHLGIADDVDVEAKGKLGHELKLELYGHARDPTAVGVGASQLIPVIVLVLGAPSGAIALLEQPELHLHPKVQSRLGDFFALARPDIRVIVETHSEYLVTRLRLRVAEGRIPVTDVAMLFASQQVVEHALEDDVNQAAEREVFSEFRRLAFNNRGDFDAWPPDFFDTLGDDSVALAQVVAARLREERQETRTDDA